MPRTISDKENKLYEKIAVTTTADWALLVSKNKAEQIVNELNIALEKVIITLKDKEFSTRGEASLMLSDAMKNIADKYSDCGLRDSESRNTLARYIALNFDITMYDYVRYDVKW